MMREKCTPPGHNTDFKENHQITKVFLLNEGLVGLDVTVLLSNIMCYQSPRKKNFLGIT